ncbi:hypothetical protein ACFVZW_05625 [Streptomyces sp. NPDC059567]|uniref:hypothetical protein n=1 Tax=Streptomyces sp. NPDC059567 TaxID=3346867 RepID=UPI0036AA2438
MNSEIPHTAPSPAAPRPPLQTPAVDRSPAAPARAGAGLRGVEASWEMPWELIGHGAKGMLDAWLSRRA